MANVNNIIGIDLGLLEEVLRTIVRQEMTVVREEIKQTVISKRELLLEKERLYIDDVAKILRVRSRHTIYNYQKSGTLPKPNRDISGRPYWTIDQLELAMQLRGMKGRFPV